MIFLHYSLKYDYSLFIIVFYSLKIVLFIIFRPPLFTIHFFGSLFTIHYKKGHYSLIIIPHLDPYIYRQFKIDWYDCIIFLFLYRKGYDESN